MANLYISGGYITVAWANDGTSDIKIRQEASTYLCPSEAEPFDFIGRVTLSTGAASGVKGKVRIPLCLDPVTGAYVLAPAQVAKF